MLKTKQSDRKRANISNGSENGGNIHGGPPGHSIFKAIFLVDKNMRRDSQQIWNPRSIVNWPSYHHKEAKVIGNA